MSQDKSTRATVTHELKCDLVPFADLLDGRKGAEVRYDDRGYQVGDVLRLREHERFGTGLPAFTGRELTRTVTHVQRGYGLPEGIVALSLVDAGEAAELRSALEMVKGDRQRLSLQLEHIQSELEDAQREADSMRYQRDAWRVDAERWRTATRFIGAWLSGGRRQVWSLESLPIPAGVNLMRGSVAEHFTNAVDAMSEENSHG